MGNKMGNFARKYVFSKTESEQVESEAQSLFEIGARTIDGAEVG